MLLNNQYQINAQQDFIDSGGFGKVYKALDTINNKTVALKQFSVSNVHERETLKAEIERAKALSHPNIVKYLDYFETQSTNSLGEPVVEQWAAMEYIAGGNLATFIEQKSLDEKTQEADTIINGIINGLDYLHTRRWDSEKSDWIKIIHRDLKPANILLHHEGDTIIPKICDFGMSKEVLESQSGSQASSTAANSTIEYAAPELFNPKLRKDGAIQTNYDYWALGVIIYKYFTNLLPFGSREQGNTLEEIMSAILEEKPKLNILPEKWRGITENCLEKDGKIRGLQNFNKTKNTKEEPKTYKKTTVLIFVSILIGLGFAFFMLNNIKRSEEEKSNLTLKLDSISKIDTNASVNESLLKDTIINTKTIETGENKNVQTNEEPNKKEFKPQKNDIKWDYTYGFVEGFAKVIKDGKCGFINTQGKLMWGGLEWDVAWDFKEGFAEVKRRNKWGFINTQGQLMWGGLEWDRVAYFYEGFAKVKKANKSGFINTQGQLMWGGLEWDNVGGFKEGIALVVRDGKHGYINTQGQLMWGGLEWDDAEDFNDGFALVIRGNKHGYINTQGQLMWGGLEWGDGLMWRSDARGFHGGFARVCRGYKYGFLNTQGQLMWGGLEWGYAQEFKDGFALVEKGKKCGYINTQGELIGSLEWDHAWNFNEGFGKVERDEKYGYINTQGKLMWGGLEWDDVGDFSEGFASVSRGYRYGFINTQGQLMWGGLEWDDTFRFNEGFGTVERDEKYGYINTQGKLMWGGLKWDDASRFYEGLAKVKKNGVTYYINTKGECVKNCP